MHVYDPAFVAVQQSWGDLPNTATLVRVAAYLPHNDEMVDLTTELAAAAPAPGSPPDLAQVSLLGVNFANFRGFSAREAA
jgi:hypothetical protein